jgi:hypothetical protein
MSAFPESGRSGITKTGEIKVRFRPQAAAQVDGFWENQQAANGHKQT